MILGWAVEDLRPVGQADPAIAEFSHDLMLGSPVDEEESLSTIIEPAGSDREEVTTRNTGTAGCLAGINFLMPQVDAARGRQPPESRARQC